MKLSLLRSLLMGAFALFVGCWTSIADTRIKIATFNIQNFGPKKAADRPALAVLAGIIRKYDVVAVQEISDVSGKAPKALLTAINYGSGDDYEMALSPRTGLQTDDRSSREQYAFYYNTRTIRKTALGRLYPDDTSDLFQREPWVASFSARAGGFTFVLITVHTDPDKAVPEIAALAKVLTWACGKYARRHAYIALGDFNAGCDYTSPTELATLRQTLPYVWIVPDSADTNLSPTLACPYDRIVADERSPARFTGNWGIDEAFTDKAISDHWPVWAEFKTGN